MISRPGDCVWRAISAETIKMPESIMDPMTSVVASSRPRPLTRLRVLTLLMRAYCTLPVLYPLHDGRGGGIRRQKVADDGDRIGARFEDGLRILAGDAADRDQRPGSKPAPGPQAIDSHHRVGIDLRLRGEHRPQGQVTRGLACRGGELLGVVCGVAENRLRADQTPGVQWWDVVLADMEPRAEQQRYVGAVI